MKIISKEEAYDLIKKNYSDEELEVIFAYHKDYPIELKDGKPRWVQTIDWEKEEGMCPNSIAIKYYEGEMTQEEYMDYNRKIGYSLYGFWEVFYFNDRFNWNQWEKDKRRKLFEDREKKLENLL